MDHPDLLKFLQNTMKMTDVYQPVVVKELLLHEGKRTKAQLAAALAAYDSSVQAYYQKIMMRWPKITLTKHGIIDYERDGSIFRLVGYPENDEVRQEATRLCEERIAEWVEKKRSTERSSEPEASVRYIVLKDAHGKCQLCGMSSEIAPIHVDHIVPRSKSNKNGKVELHSRLIDVNDRENLQALCYACNTAKRDEDQTDFRRREKVVRDRIPEIMRAEGLDPEIKELTGTTLTAALYDKLVEEHAELLAAKTDDLNFEELADMIEVIFTLSKNLEFSEDKLMEFVRQKRGEKGGFFGGLLMKVR